MSLSTSISIKGKQTANGTVYCSGSKNAILPMLCCSLLTEEVIEISSLPYINDIRVLLNLLVSLGVNVELIHSDRVRLCASDINLNHVALHQISKMRASILLLGPLLTKFKRLTMPTPGGCVLGERPINYHLQIMQQLGAQITEYADYFEVSILDGLKSAAINLPFPSVTATENALLAMSKARGTSVLNNASTEPEVIETAKLLKAMGAKISGEGTNIIHVEGVEKLYGAVVKAAPDRIECGTWMALAVATGGKVTITNTPSDNMGSVIALCKAMGATLQVSDNSITVDMQNKKPVAVSFIADVNQKFPTDLQPIFSMINAIARGSSSVVDAVFKNRFNHVSSLQKMGANISMDWPKISIQGVEKITGSEVIARDLRGAASLVIAACCADGQTTIHQADYLDRGYEFIDEKLNGLGIAIHRMSAPEQYIAVKTQ